MTKYKIRYTPAALKDMECVWDDVYKASSDFDVANRYVDGFISELSKKSRFPKSGIPLEYDGLFTGFYSVNYKKYKAFYRVCDDYIEIIRIIISTADYMTVLFG